MLILIYIDNFIIKLYQMIQKDIRLLQGAYKLHYNIYITPFMTIKECFLRK